MTDNLKNFLNEAASNKELQSAIIQINREHPNKEENLKQLIELASAHGFTLTAEDFSAYKQELNEDDLDNISGGEVNTDSFGRLRSNCGCYAYGHGASDEYQYDCGCIAGGVGSFTEEGYRLVKDGKLRNAGADGAPVPMWCFFIGAAD